MPRPPLALLDSPKQAPGWVEAQRAAQVTALADLSVLSRPN